MSRTKRLREEVKKMLGEKGEANTVEIFDHLMLAIYFESFQSGAPRVQLSIIKITANIFRENI